MAIGPIVPREGVGFPNASKKAGPWGVIHAVGGEPAIKAGPQGALEGVRFDPLRSFHPPAGGPFGGLDTNYP